MKTIPSSNPVATGDGPTFLEYLAGKELITPEQIRAVEDETGSRSPEFLCGILCRNEFIDEETAYRAVAEFYGCPFVDLRKTGFDPVAIRELPVEVCRRYTAIPFFLLDGEISVAMASVELDDIEALSRITKCKVMLHLAPRAQILEAIDTQYFAREVNPDAVRISGLVSSQKEGGETGEIQQLSHLLIAKAIQERASDIHLEPEEGFLRIRYRVDGIMREEMKLPIDILLPLVARYKVMASLNISEQRRPQDGRIHLTIGSREFDIRMSVVPSKGAEKVVLRILDKSGVNMDIDHMYLSEAIQKRLKKIISVSSGFILVTGPTGSGKTTFCYSIINRLNTVDRNIVTIEDPVEYRFPLVTQIQVQHEIGMDFPAILRSVLRQDPNVIFVGEIRDRETARVATEAALTGHLVLSTMHTNNAVQAVIRMVEIGVEPFMVAPSIEGVMSQRLVRRICPRCRATYVPDLEERAHFHLSQEESDRLRLYRGTGCTACHGTGYFGRLAVHELVIVTDEIRGMILKGAAVSELEMAASRGGYRTMRYDGLKKALIGLTTIEEVVRVTLEREDVDY